MKITIEFYASLMKYLPPGKHRFRREVNLEAGISLDQLIRQYNISEQEAHLVLVNGRFVNPGEDRQRCELVEGDTVSIWPPVAGG